MRSLPALLILISIGCVQGVAFHANLYHAPAAVSEDLVGRWQVRVKISGVGEKNLIFESRASGLGSFHLLDTRPDNKPEANAQPAVWSQTMNNRASFSGEVELPIGTCCRETGTLILKGRFTSNNSISGKALFVGNTENEEDLTGFRSMAGTFVATRIPK